MSFCKNATEFNGQKSIVFDKKKGIEDVNVAYSFAWDWDNEEDVDKILEVFFKDPKISEITNIIIGNYGESDTSPLPFIKLFLDNKDKLQNLKGIFFGDITYEENECSWIQNDNFGPIIKAFPNLEIFKVRGGNNLSFSFLEHKKLKTLIIESGGIEKNIFKEISNADLPALEHLEIWLGDDNYGFDATPAEVAMAYRGNKENHLPSLKYLGLRNSLIADDIANFMINDPIINRIEVLDYSKGILSNKGAKAILNNPLLKNLKKLDLHHNFIADELAEKIIAEFGDKVNLDEREAIIPMNVDMDSEDFDRWDYDMYLEVSE